MSGPGKRRYRQHLGVAAFSVAAIVPVLVALWCIDVLPTHDGPKHVYAAHVWFHADEPWMKVAFDRQWPITSWGFGLVYGLLQKLVSWRAAYTSSLTLITLGLSVGFLSLAKGLHPRRWPLTLLVLGASLSWPIYMGFFNYVGSVALGLGALALGLATPRWTVWRELAIAALLLATCAFHPVGAQVAGLGLGLFRLLELQRGRWLRELGALFLIGVPALAVSLVSSDVLAEQHAQGLIMINRVKMTPLESLENFGLCYVGGPPWRAWPLVALAAIGVIASVIALVRRRLPNASLVVLLLSVLATCAAFYAPFHGEGWQYFSPRFIPFAVLLGVSLVPLEGLGASTFALTLGLALSFDIAANGWAARYQLAWRERWTDALSGLGVPATKGRTLLPIVARPEIMANPAQERRLTIPYASPLLNLGELYGVDRDAVTPYSFSSIPLLHLIQSKKGTMRHIPKKDYGFFFADGVDPAERRAELVRLASYGTRFDDVVFVGDADDVDVLVSVGYVAELRQKGFMLGQFRGCSATVTVSNATGPVSVLLGWQPSDWIVERLRFEPHGPDPIELPKVSCTGAWLRVMSEDGAPCLDSDGAARLHSDGGDSQSLACAFGTAAPAP